MLALVLIAASSLVVGAGCGKYSSTCKESAELSSPWTSLGFPVDDGRVCESSAKKTRVQFISKDAKKWQGAFEEKLLSGGYTKKECKNDYCIYEKGEKGKDSRVQMIVSSVDKWVNVTLNESR